MPVNAEVHAIEIVCHRGANEFAPENTYASSQICMDWGMDVVEIDVNTSNDGVLYLFHGPELEKTTEGKGLIMAHLSQDIDRLHAGYQIGGKYKEEKIPRLEEYLSWAKGKAKLFLDVKFVDLHKMIRCIRETGWEQDCFFWFGIPELAQTFRKLAPDLQLKVNANSVEEIQAAVSLYQANIIETDADKMSEEMRNTCHHLGLRWMVYYKGSDETEFRRIIAMQPDLVNTNYGDRFLNALNQFHGENTNQD